MDRMREQCFSCAGLAQKHHRYFGLRGQRCQLQTTRHALIARRQIFDPQPGERLLHCASRIYWLTLSRNCRIGSKAYSISVRPPTIIWASPCIPTRRGKICPGRGEITERSSEPSAMKCELSPAVLAVLAVTAEGLIQSSFPVTAP